MENIDELASTSNQPPLSSTDTGAATSKDNQKPKPPEEENSEQGEPGAQREQREQREQGEQRERREQREPREQRERAEEERPQPKIERTVIDFALGSITSDGATTVAGMVNHFAAPSTEVLFSPQLASRLGDATERELRTVVTLDRGFSERLIATLDKRRVILLSGATQTGKGTVAKYLATLIAAREKLVNETFVVGPLENRVRVLPRQLAADKTFGSRVTIFEDAFEYGNRDLLAFFRSDSVAWEEMRASLTANNAFFIFTTSHGQMEAFRDRVRVSCFEVTPPPELVGTAIDRKLEWLDAEAAWLKERVGDIRREREVIVQKLQTIPRIASMIDDYVGGDEQLDTVLDRHASASPSLLDDLQTDVEAWCFALTLAIAETGDEPLPWSAFERLRRLLTDHIKNDRELFPRRLSIRRSPAYAERSATGWLSDKLLLTRCQATFRKDPSGLCDVPAFVDPACSRRIWKSLLDHHRRVLLILTPLLRAIAENAELSADLRVLAAHALGRIGAIDPPAITLTLIKKQQETPSEQPLRWFIGPLVRGAVTSSHERYPRTVLGALAALSDVPAAESSKLDCVITAIIAYSHLGSYVPAKPMVQLREIAARHCVRALLNVYAEVTKGEASNREQEAARTQQAADEAGERAKKHDFYAREHQATCNVIAVPLQFAIARLCLEDIQALTTLRDWISTGGSDMRVFIPYLFLAPGGVADTLDVFAVDGGDASVRINAIIFAAAASRQSQNDLAALLCDIYGAIGSNPLVPGIIQRKLEERLAKCMIRWAVSAAPSPRFRHGLEELFGTLAAARGGVMRRWLFALLRKPEFAQTEDLKAFASATRGQLDL
ncbi:MAG TPA: hypothetical protein VJZ00_11755 [Thermoanaerobaculia bacterium]|nr:hypothetical protein [Thermoanaerobaculia bacterium]